MPLLRRRIRCHFCNQQSREPVARIPPTYLCLHCDAVNHFDERGHITDPPVEHTTTAPTTALHYANTLPRSSSPVMPPEPPPLFCSTCQRNQLLLNKTLAEYLPDDDDPDYNQYAASLDAYRRELEDRYPQVCSDCLPRVQHQIRAAGYAAKADNLRRIMDRSRQHSRVAHTTRQTWTLRLIALAKAVYLASVVTGLLWHVTALTVAVDGHTPLASEVLQTSLALDWSTVWWNPKLASKTNSITGRMRGLRSLWAIRALVLTLRTAAFFYWKTVPLSAANLSAFHNTNTALIFAILLSLFLTWKTVRIVYTPVALPEDSYIPSAPNTPHRPKSSYKPAHPNTSTFDTMAQGFTSSFQLDAASALPPSPTLTEASTTSHYTDFTTPAHKSVYQDDSMDWTPTARRFAPAAAEILPPQFGARTPNPPASPASDRRHEPVSLFAKPDPNPFRHKVPAAPKPPAQARADPWRRSPWAPPLKETTPNFFRTERTTRSQARAATQNALNTNTASLGRDPTALNRDLASPSPFPSPSKATLDDDDDNNNNDDDPKKDTGLQGFGVPRNVRRDAELFATPKLKYDYYGTMRDTGLEDTFNALFSK